MQINQHLLEQHFAALPFTLTPEQVTLFVQLAELVYKWNQAFNLLGFKDADELIIKHYLDSLVVLPFVEGERVADIGTGAGFPGLPLALMRPEWQFTLVDSNIKKTRFVQQAVIELKLKNVEVLHARVEQIKPIEKFNTVVSRAFSDLSDFVQKTCNISCDQGLFMAMKGRYPRDEIAALVQSQNAQQVEAVHQLHVPGLDAERHVVLVRNCS